MIASDATANLRAELVELEIFSSSGQPARVTPNGLFLNGLSSGAAPQFLFERPSRRSPFLLMTPDAVMRLIEAAGEIGARIGQRKSLTPSNMVTARFHASTRYMGQLERNKLHEVSLRGARKARPLVRSTPFGRVRGKCRIA